jgi:hypothetical protein
MSVSSNILTVLEPTIVLEEVQLPNAAEDVNGGASQTPSKRAGDLVPMVIINGYTLNDTDMLQFELELSEEVPKLYIKFEDSRNLFTIDNYPRDGGIINVRISSKNPEIYKSIRMDFDIVQIYGNTTQPEAGTPEFTVFGICSVPGLYAEDCKSYGEGTSLDHLEAIATDLKLGLATNVMGTNDSMIRICPYVNRFSFLKDLVDSSYIGEESFQTFHIDQYYYINYVDINHQINIKADFEETFYTFLQDNSVDIKNTKLYEMSCKLLLTNNSNFHGTSNHITAFTLENRAFDVVETFGYKRDLQYYDHNEEEKLKEFTLEALSSKNMLPIESPLRNRMGGEGEERYKLEKKHKYVGRQFYSDDAASRNTHLNFNYTVVQNLHNNAELEKLQLVVELGGPNMSLYRYQKLPVIIYEQDMTRKLANQEKEEKAEKVGLNEGHFDGAKNEKRDGDFATAKINNFLSGTYLIGKITYKFSRDTGMIQNLTLLRREWPVPMKQLPDSPST